MATLSAIRELRYNNDFRNKIEGALLKQIVTILQENSGVANHAARLTWAKANMANTDPVILQVAALLAAAPSIQDTGANTTDAALDNAVGQVVNVLAVG